MEKVTVITDYWLKHCRTLWGIVLLSTSCAMTPQSSVPIASHSNNLTPSSQAQINQVLASLTTQNVSPVKGYRLGPEDLIRVTIFNIPEGEGAKGVTPRSIDVRVSDQGSVNLPLLNDVNVQGLTISEVERQLNRMYDKYIHKPQIGVLVVEYRSQRVSVVGAVQNPGIIELSGPKTVIDLLAKAGGLSPNAGNQVHLYREGPEGRVSYMIDLLTVTKGVGSDVTVLNLPVQGGDVITVPEAGTFFVDGAVLKPGSYPLTRPYTVSQALVTAGGVNRELAKTSDITLYRQRGSAGVESIALNLGEIVSGKQPDPQVGAEDVIVVPISAPKYLVRRFLGVLVSGFSIERLALPY